MCYNGFYLMNKVNFGKESYIAPSWEEMGELCFELSKKILQKNQKFDRLIALVKGGLTWSRTMLDYLAISHISSFQVKFYSNIKRTDQKPIVIQALPIDVEGENILLFDDVADTGETLDIASNYLKMRGAKNISSATLFSKPWSKHKPDFYAQKTDAWIIFPHEIRETINLLSKNWQKKKLSKKEIYSRLIKTGLPEEQVEYFLKR